MHSSTHKAKPRVAFLTNTLAPYRVPIYAHLARDFSLAVFVAARESNRDSWEDVEESLESLGVRVSYSWGWSAHRETGFDHKYFHITPGYFADLLRYRPAAVITNEMGLRTALALLYRTLYGTPVWVWWGGTLHTEHDVGVLRRAVRTVLPRMVPRWISYGSTSTEYLQSLGVKRDRILQIQNCVAEMDFVAAAGPVFSCEPKPVLLCVGQMIGRKGVKLLLEAAARVQGMGHRFSLLLVGDGPETAALKLHAERLGLANVYFQPAQPPASMPAVYRSANALIFPTLKDPWGLVVNEALWSDLPVVASIYAGCTSEIVPAGNRFDPLDPRDFDRVLVKAVTGQLKPPDTSVLLPCTRVAEIISQDILQTLMKQSPTAPSPTHGTPPLDA